MSANSQEKAANSWVLMLLLPQPPEEWEPQCGRCTQTLKVHCSLVTERGRRLWKWGGVKG